MGDLTDAMVTLPDTGPVLPASLFLYDNLSDPAGAREVVAYAIFLRSWSDATQAYLFSFGVRPARRGQGIGRWWMGRLVEEVVADGCRSISLTVDPANEAAVHLYRDRFGFEQAGFRPSWYGPGEDRLHLILRCGPAPSAGSGDPRP